MQRQYTFSTGEFYHLYNRGVEKRDIFIEKKDWERFHKLLYVANSTIPFRFAEIEDQAIDTIDRGDTIVAIGAYVLMPNHFHILVKKKNQKKIRIYIIKK